MGLNLIKKYYRQLIFLSNRFPMKSGEECASEFSWYLIWNGFFLRLKIRITVFLWRNELYSMKNVTQSDIRFELEAIMYNIGAMHSYLGCIDKRSNDDVKIIKFHIFISVILYQTTKKYWKFTTTINENITIPIIRVWKSHVRISNMRLGRSNKFATFTQYTSYQRTVRLSWWRSKWT